MSMASSLFIVYVVQVIEPLTIISKPMGSPVCRYFKKWYMLTHPVRIFMTIYGSVTHWSQHDNFSHTKFFCLPRWVTCDALNKREGVSEWVSEWVSDLLNEGEWVSVGATGRVRSWFEEISLYNDRLLKLSMLNIQEWYYRIIFDISNCTNTHDPHLQSSVTFIRPDMYNEPFRQSIILCTTQTPLHDIIPPYTDNPTTKHIALNRQHFHVENIV